MPEIEGPPIFLPGGVDDEFKARFLKAGLRRGRRKGALLELEDELQEAPPWLRVTPKEFDRIKDLIADVTDRYPVTRVDELVWCLLIDAVRPQPRGRKGKWLGIAGVALVSAVHVALRNRGATSKDRKALRQVIAEIRRADPQSYGKFSEERLRDAYYDALPRARYFLGQE